MKLFSRFKSETLWIVLFFSLVATGLLAPIASENYIPNLADYITHLGGIVQAKMALAEGQFPLRIAPLEQAGLRYPFFQFYSPTCYTFAALIYKWLSPNNPLIAFKITVWFALVIGGVYMNRVAYDLVKSRPAAILAGLAYLTTPYYIIVVNHLGNLTESVALGIFPAALFYTLRFFYHPEKIKLFLQTSLAWYLLSTIHILTFFYASFFTALLLCMKTYQHPRYANHLLKVGFAYTLACLLAMWYLAPIIMLKKFFLFSSTIADADFFVRFSPVLSDLLFPAAGITPGSKSAFITIHPSIGWPILFAICLCTYAFFNKQSILRPRANLVLSLLLLIFLIAFIMVWSPFNFWHWMPQIFISGQYSWRILSQVIWIGSILFAWALCWLFKNRLEFRHIILGSFILMMLANPWFPQNESYATSLEDFLKNPSLLMAKSNYLINFNANPQFVDAIENMQIDPLMIEGNLQIDTVYHFPQALTQLASAATITLVADVPTSLENKNLQLNAVANGVIIATKMLHPGNLSWNIPLSAILQKEKNKNNLDFKFTFSKKSTLKIPVTKLNLTGFLDPAKTISLEEIKPNCRQEQTKTLCHFTMPATTTLVELPVLYYPQLLTIAINGNIVPYKSVLDQNILIASIMPETSKINDISIEFTGLHWANLVSWAAWALWIFIFIIVIFQQLLLRKR